jgi:pyruvate formate lyase activating enzyme
MDTPSDSTDAGPRAEFWDAAPGGRVQCRLCPHHCQIAEGRYGACRVRRSVAGELRAAGYGLVSSAHVDPVEKKPLYHFHPGEAIYSIGGWGCNFACRFCQNWSISQALGAGRRCRPEDVVGQARASGCRLLAYTYNEPLVGFEFVRDCSRLARAAGLRNVLVTNGYVEREPAAQLLPLTAALNVDIKSSDESFYHTQCRGRLQPVLDFCCQARAAGCHLEITNLLIPGLNDQPDAIERLVRWVREHLGAETPLHFSAYHPDYQSTIEPTPPETLQQAYRLGRQHLTYVYLGNVRAAEGQDTACPACGNVLVRRRGYAVERRGLRAPPAGGAPT